MKWDIQTVGFTAKGDLLEIAKESITKLEKFYAPIVGAEIYFKLEYDKKDEDKKVTIKLNIPGEDVSGEHHAHSFEAALHECIEKVKRQLIRKKDLERSHR